MLWGEGKMKTMHYRHLELGLRDCRGGKIIEAWIKRRRAGA